MYSNEHIWDVTGGVDGGYLCSLDEAVGEHLGNH